MAEQFASEGKHEALEADIGRLTEEIGKHRERPEAQSLSGEELVKQSLKSMTGPPPQHKGSAPKEEAAGPLPQYAQTAPAGAKLEIEHLLDMAFHAGIEKASAEARKSSPFVLDAFHDALAGRLYPELKRRGILK